MAKRVAIIASNGGLEAAYKVLNIATAAAATDAEVGIFFTFEGLSIIHKQSETMLKLRPENEHFSEGFKRANVPTVSELLEIAQDSGVKMIACQMTVDVMGLSKDDFIDGIEVGGAVAFLDFAYDADVSVTF
ncbi:DsrE/DsrF/DrsH-like family protein [Ferroacidibacillus organovorans]|uniref:Sulfur reduction protein DsrE n=1 Tax=Ferroacidibacillus organovorans TaxID=1765683 RepID=A0A162UP23_9BACL|nr:DsrE/DsrF/DrsH-like family protein [Ferroacidibacillus organovorans]KYP81917.1 sulfur reduction protein DsrE [Ferroacidibacillus organovorans]OAG94892.1 sulfur reduction protein DsrE [Ferroacidibacillus organovorans]OPG15028.1 sulfur reduction protein DsrE [Ferroacidibacillus organovorans]